jgi:dihydroorotate dehydrogenase (fumarate)
MDLSTSYMGLRLASPIVASASPLTGELESIKRIVAAGAGAVVLHSLFEEQIAHEEAELEHYLHYGTERFPESITYFPNLLEYRLGPDQYLDLIRAAKASVDVPIIASLNCVSRGAWSQYASQMEQAGADAIECNVYYIPTSPEETPQEVEERYLGALEAMRQAVKTPVAMKLSPFFSSPVHMMRRLDAAGASGLVLFNRFYQPDIDVENLDVRPRLVLSTSAECRLPLRWIAIVRGHVRASLAASSGVHTGLDAAKMILAGADVVMMTSALLEHGPEHVRTVLDELKGVMESREYDSVSQMRGVLSQHNCPDPAAFERANYMRTLASFGMTATLE